MERPIARLALSLLIYLVAVACVAALYRESLLLTAIMAALAAVTLLIGRRKGDLIVFASGATLGLIAEVTAVRFSAWEYAHPDFLGIPLWLPVGWGLTTLLIKRISEGLIELRRRD
jgi:hypothetical protein